MKYVLFLIVMMFSHVFPAQGREIGKGIRSGGLARADAVLPGDPWAVVHNPAVLSLKPVTGISVFTAPSLFGLKELKTVALSGTLVIPEGIISASIEQFGFDLYREVAGTIGFGSSLAIGLSGGMAFEWRRIAVKGYGRSDALIVNAGCTIDLAKEFSMGFVGHNIFGETLGNDEHRLPQTTEMGIAYSPLASTLILLEVEKEMRFPLTIKAGLEIYVMESLVFRSGIEHNPDILTAGLSVLLGPTEFGYAGSVHSQLGWTHQFEISVRLTQ